MLEIYWIFLISGLVLAIITVIFGGVIGDILDGIFDSFLTLGVDFFHPMVICGAITIFGGSGIILTEYTNLSTVTIAIFSLIIALFFAILIHFFYIKPMKGAENSTGFSIYELVGNIGEVITTIPAKGYGEVLIKVGSGHTNQIAASYDHEEIQSGIRVFVVEVKDSILYVSRFENI